MSYEFENLQFSYHSRMSSKHDINLAQLVQLFYTEQIQSSQHKRLETLSYIFTHQQLKSSIKNQSQILKKIFNHSTVKTLISYLNQQNQQHAQFLKTIKYDPSGEEVPHCLKMPYMAMELLTCQCHIINDLLFQGEEGNKEPLLPYLLQFLDHPQHYHLASYFSKVMSAITKRVCSATHKYNPLLSNYVFGNQDGAVSIEKSCLYKAVNHLYSLSMIDCIIRWLSISTKVKVKEEVDGEIFQKVVVDVKRNFKEEFVLYLIDKINRSGYDSQILNNIPNLIEQMLAQRDKNNKIASSLMIKSFGNTSSSTQKFTLYDLVIKQEILNSIFGPPQENRVNLAKLKLIKIFLLRYTNQLALFQKNSQEPIEIELKLLQMVTFDHLNQLIEWIFTDLKMMLGVDTISNSKQSSPHDEQLQNQTSRVRVSSSGKMIILHLLEILKYVHNLSSFRPQLIQYYNENSNCLVRLFKRLMCLENNLIQIETNKLVITMLKKNMKDKNRPDIPLEFARKLLTIAIIKLIQLGVARSHVIQWADKILSIQEQHIFENYQEEFEWDHIREIIEDERKIQIGGYRLVQANLQTFYSEEKALFAYSDFLNFKAEVVYQDKKEKEKQKNIEDQSENIDILPVSIPIQKQSTQNTKQYQEIQKIIQTTITIQNFENKTQQNPTLLGLFRGNYLEFDIDDLMKQI